jgi:predicted GTPase
MADQLPLFSWAPPVKVIPFPASKRVGKINRLAAQIINACSEKDRNWRMTRAVDGMFKQMKRADIPTDEIEREVNEFIQAVVAECRKAGLDMALLERWKCPEE